MDSIIKQLSDVAAIKISAKAGQILNPMADRAIKAQAHDESDPDYREMINVMGFNTGDELDEPEKWMWFFSELLDSVAVRQRDGTYQTFTVEASIKYFWFQMLQRKGTTAFDQGVCDELREEAKARWSYLSSVEPVAEYPEGSWDILKEIASETLASVSKWKDGDHKEEAVSICEAVIANC
jgi:hypothetical protein